MDLSVITNFVVNLAKTKDTVVFSCSENDLLQTSLALMGYNQFVFPVHIGKPFLLPTVLTKDNFARTTVIVDTGCNASVELLAEASKYRYYNKTYQWLLWGIDREIDDLLPPALDYIGPNAQITYVNRTKNGYLLWDVHSKGRHLKSVLELNLIAIIVNNDNRSSRLNIKNDIFELQSSEYRNQFNGLTLRGASVIDQEDITTNEQIIAILSRPEKDSGVAAFVKYHYELMRLLRDRFNFTVDFRNSRGWAGRLGNTTFRLGLLGIIMRNEADIAASGAFNRINRFAEFDTIHQSWKFETAFLYRFTPDLDTHGKSGNFLAPFSQNVWFFTIGTLAVINFTWILFESITSRINKLLKFTNLARVGEITKINWSERSLQTFGAACQQGMDPIPKDMPSRSLVVTVFLFSLVMYNYYTSYVVGGLLSSSDQGPATVDEITSSPLKLSFEDIGYYKVLFRESENPVVKRLISKKLSSSRAPNDLQIYTHIEEAVPYLKTGGFAFHCEVVDAYPMIAELFDATEICDLREVSGLMNVEILNWIVPKNSQYTEIFRSAMCYARETGLVERILRRRQMKKPTCQSLYTVYPVSLSGVTSAFFTVNIRNIHQYANVLH
ncbi:ionotropic receptor 75a [Drosophila tropicalis]|uniref:ionotropic receptor 75a n=1 Tax=Drosophila tropicalis TaxID=46794 RepID=UPI0035ABDFC9